MQYLLTPEEYNNLTTVSQRLATRVIDDLIEALDLRIACRIIPDEAREPFSYRTAVVCGTSVRAAMNNAIDRGSARPSKESCDAALAHTWLSRNELLDYLKKLRTGLPKQP